MKLWLDIAFRKAVRYATSGLVAFAIAACGGGGGSPGASGNGSNGSNGSSTSGSSGSSATVRTPVAMNFVSSVPSDKSIVIKGAGGNGRTEVALLTFRVVDSTNSGVPNVAVTFTPQSVDDTVTLVSSTGTTDADGNVTVTLTSGAKPTPVRVLATVQGGGISALSDQVTVTTGLPTQTAMSLGLAKYFVEALNHLGTENKVDVYLGDAFGGTVPDGTQVVFTTDSGTIVGDGGAQCLTVKGTCQVTWRSQNPFNANGVGKIEATATNGSDILRASVNFYTSGSYATVYQVTGPAGSTTRLPSPIAMDFTTSCETQSINVEIVDANGNPMPEGAVISGVNGTNASLTVFPSTVSYTGNLFLSSTHRGTVHNIKVAPSGCTVGGGNTKTGEIYISVKTPLGGETFTRINLGTFPAN